MANKAFSQLPAAGTLTGTEIVAITQGGASVRTTLALIKALFGVGGKYRTTIGDGAAASFTLTHSLNTKDVHVTVYRNATPWDTIICDVQRPNDNQITVSGFGSAPTLDQFVVVVWS